MSNRRESPTLDAREQSITDTVLAGGTPDFLPGMTHGAYALLLDAHQVGDDYAKRRSGKHEFVHSLYAAESLSTGHGYGSEDPQYRRVSEAVAAKIVAGEVLHDILEDHPEFIEELGGPVRAFEEYEVPQGTLQLVLALTHNNATHDYLRYDNLLGMYIPSASGVILHDMKDAERDHNVVIDERPGWDRDTGEYNFDHPSQDSRTKRMLQIYAQERSLRNETASIQAPKGRSVWRREARGRLHGLDGVETDGANIVSIFGVPAEAAVMSDISLRYGQEKHGLAV